MNPEKEILPYEAHMLNELMIMKQVCASKSTAMLKLVKDHALKSMIQQDLVNTKEQIKELQSLLQTHTPISGLNRSVKPVQTSRFASSGILDEVKDKEAQPRTCTDGRNVNPKGASL